MQWEGDLNLIMLVSNHLIICNESHIYLYPLASDITLITNIKRNWSFEKDISLFKNLRKCSKKRRKSLQKKI